MNPKKLIIAVLVSAGVGLYMYRSGSLPGFKRTASAVPTAFNLQTDEARGASDGVVALAPLPSTKIAGAKGVQFRMNVWAWNAQMGLFLANGGPLTTTGSLMDKHGVRLKIERQDMTDKSQEGQILFANALAGGESNPAVGIHFTIIMGDQAAGYLSGINRALEKLGDDYRAEVIGSVGRSKGEDGFWGPQGWKDSPESMKGGGVATVIREGDWNIVQYDLAANGIKSNPDTTTWDPDAMNFFAAADNLKAAEMYIQGYCEDRRVVRNGKITTEAKHHLCVEGTSVWTPADVNQAKAKGGLVRILSTKENVNQMPAVIVGIRKWNLLHAKEVTEMLAAVFEGSDQVRNHDEALSRAGQISYAIYADQSASYWVKYYKGVVERDKTQQPVPLGGSDVMNFADNALFFGLTEESGGLGNSLFNATYTGFGNIVKQQYPNLLPSFPPIDKAVNTQFLEALKSRMSTTNASVEEFVDPAEVTKENTVASRDWSIQFETGSASFTPQAQATLAQIYQQLSIGGGLTIEISGHTDNVGNPAQNLGLSERRAQAVKAWLQAVAPATFPDNRLSIKGFGDTKPVASNDTPDGRAKNRHVTIKLGTR